MNQIRSYQESIDVVRCTGDDEMMMMCCEHKLIQPLAQSRNDSILLLIPTLLWPRLIKCVTYFLMCLRCKVFSLVNWGTEIYFLMHNTFFKSPGYNLKALLWSSDPPASGWFQMISLYKENQFGFKDKCLH
jgi:hypothetical protein